MLLRYGAHRSRGQYWAEVRVLMIHNRYRLPGGEDVAVAADGLLLRKPPQLNKGPVLFGNGGPPEPCSLCRGNSLLAGRDLGIMPGFPKKG